MVPSSLAFLLALWLMFFNLVLANSSEVSKTNEQPSPTACVDCTICPYPCHKLSPPPPGYPLPGAPPPPSSQGSGYPLYGAPPPPPPQVQGNCPPGQAQCCVTPPPNTYTYLRNDSHSALPHSTISLVSILILLVSFTSLF